MKITENMAFICGEFMLDEDPTLLWLPFNVAKALAYFASSKSSLHAAYTLAQELQVWYDNDPTTCEALLGPGLETDDEHA